MIIFKPIKNKQTKRKTNINKKKKPKHNDIKNNVLERIGDFA